MIKRCTLISKNQSALGPDAIKRRDLLLDDFYRGFGVGSKRGVQSNSNAQQQGEQGGFLPGFDLSRLRERMRTLATGKNDGYVPAVELQRVLDDELGVSGEVAKAYCTNFNTLPTRGTHTGMGDGWINYEDFIEEVLRYQLERLTIETHDMFMASAPSMSLFAKAGITFQEFSYLLNRAIGNEEGDLQLARLRAAVEENAQSGTSSRTSFNARELAVWYFTHDLSLQRRRERTLTIETEIAQKNEKSALAVEKYAQLNDKPNRLQRMEELRPSIDIVPRAMSEYTRLYHTTAKCSFKYTGRKGAVQEWGYCVTCNGDADVGMCTVCALICHKGHKIERGPPKRNPGKFFCDCGAGGMCNPCSCINNQ